MDVGAVFGGATSAASNVGGCLHCHAGWRGDTTVGRQASYGGIHGSWTTYTAGATTGVHGYRFFPGAWMRILPPGGNAGWGSNANAATTSCYFWNDATQGFSACTAHAGTAPETGEGVYNNWNRATRY